MPSLSLASGVAPEASALELIAAAEAAGYEAVGLWLDERFTPSYCQQVKSAIANAGLRVLDAEVFWLKSGPFDEQLLHRLDIACALGAEHVLVVSSDPDQHSTVTKIQKLCAHVQGWPIRVMLEFGAFTEVKGLIQASQIIRAVGSPQLGLLIDALHWYRCGNSLEQIRSLPSEWLSYAQLCDASGPSPDLADSQAVRLEAVDYRLLPGDGDMPLQDWLQTLPSHIPLSLEIRSKSLRAAYPSVIERAKVVRARTLDWIVKNSPD